MRWLVVSLVLSVALTVLLNAALRVFPQAGDRLARGLGERSQTEDHARRDNERVRVVVPWKAMIVGSLILTFLVNLLLRVL